MDYFDAHTHSQTLGPNTLSVVNQALGDAIPEGRLYSVGFHPWHLHELNFEDNIQQLEAVLKSGNVAAIGETGIDRAIYTPIEVQIKWFTAQCLLAEQYHKPVIVHCVRAWADIVGIRKALVAKQPWVIHGYNGNLANALQLIKAGCFLSFGASLKQSPKLKELALQLPLDALLTETDDSPVAIEEIHALLANVLNLSSEQLSEVLRQNFNRVFGVDRIS